MLLFLSVHNCEVGIHQLLWLAPAQLIKADGHTDRKTLLLPPWPPTFSGTSCLSPEPYVHGCLLLLLPLPGEVRAEVGIGGGQWKQLEAAGATYCDVFLRALPQLVF